MLLNKLQDKKLIHAPEWLPNNTQYLTLMGSVAYGVSSDTSDSDVYGFAIPPKSLVFPHTAGEIPGFGRQIKRFDMWQEHHINDSSEHKQYDFSVYSIVRYFHLVMENNPNMVDSLFVPINCIIHITRTGEFVRDARRIFLHKGSYHKFLGYAHSQLHKISTKTPQPGSNRSKLVEQYGFDTKFAYHIVRLADEEEQILTTGDIDLRRSKEMMKAVRRGEVTQKDLMDWFSEKEKTLEKLYRESKLRHTPDEAAIKQLLLNCLESHYGSLDKLGYVNPGAAEDAIAQIEAIVNRYKNKLRGVSYV